MAEKKSPPATISVLFLSVFRTLKISSKLLNYTHKHVCQNVRRNAKKGHHKAYLRHLINGLHRPLSQLFNIRRDLALLESKRQLLQPSEGQRGF